jgi:hypothetical protein
MIAGQASETARARQDRYVIAVTVADRAVGAEHRPFGGRCSPLKRDCIQPHHCCAARAARANETYCVGVAADAVGDSAVAGCSHSIISPQRGHRSPMKHPVFAMFAQHHFAAARAPLADALVLRAPSAISLQPRLQSHAPRGKQVAGRDDQAAGGPAALAAAVASSTAFKMRRARCRNASPEGSKRMPRGVRTKSGVPISASSAWIWRLTGGCATCSFSAARPTFPASATATK